MNQKLLVTVIAVLLGVGGCSIQFPLSDNAPSFQNNNSNDAPTFSSMSLMPTEPNTRDPIKGNSADTPE